MSKHTPGPWHVGKGEQAQIVYDEGGWAVANAVVFHRKHEPGSTLVNARLIAAAPDLLEALDTISRLYNHDASVGENSMAAYDAACIARYAIAKATGERQ